MLFQNLYYFLHFYNQITGKNQLKEERVYCGSYYEGLMPSSLREQENQRERNRSISRRELIAEEEREFRFSFCIVVLKSQLSPVS